MKSKIFTIYDSKIGAYLNPFMLRNGAEAIRSFETAVNDQKTELHAHPEDYTLFEIGEYDDESGSYTNLDAKISLGNALQYKKQDTILKSVN